MIDLWRRRRGAVRYGIAVVAARARVEGASYQPRRRSDVETPAKKTAAKR